MRYDFEWSVTKERKNYKKHKIGFERATSVFKDPNAISIFDKKHSDEEDRWVTMGIDNAGALLVVVHSYKVINKSTYNIRIISARKATKLETGQY